MKDNFYKKLIKNEYERLFHKKGILVKTKERCRKCGKWDRTIKWCKGLNPPKCKCKHPATIVKNYV